MFKRCCLCAIAFIIVLLSAACTGEAPPTPDAPMVVQDIMSGNGDASGDPGITLPPDSITSDNQQTEALTEEKTYLQTEIDVLNQKLADLQWLRDSYITQNPADLQAKLAACDAKIASINAQLQGLQIRMVRNDQDQHILDGDESATVSEDIPIETPLESAADSSEPEESVS